MIAALTKHTVPLCNKLDTPGIVRNPSQTEEVQLMMRTFATTLLAGIAFLAVAEPSLAQTGPRTSSGPSIQTLLKADSDSANWMLPGPQL